MKRVAVILLAVLAGFAAYPAVTHFAPPLSTGFWSLACARRVDYNDVAPAAHFMAIMKSPLEEVSFKLLFRVATPSGKLYALAGLRETLDGAEFEILCEQLEQIGGTVQFRAGCTESPQTMRSMIDVVRAGDFPIYHHLEKTANQALQPTRMLVTFCAYAQPAPSTRVADL